MTDDELNRYLHEKVMGECATLLDYCHSLDAVAKVEAKLMEIPGGDFQLVKALNGIVGEGVPYFASARQRAEACKEAFENK